MTQSPQPNFVGPAPAQVVQGAQELGQRWGQLIGNGISEGVQAYQNAQELKQRADLAKQAETSASEQLRLKYLMEDFQNALVSAGGGNEWKVLREKEPQAREIFTFLAKGNADLANSMFESTAKQFLGNASSASLAKAGVLGFGQAEALTSPPVSSGFPMDRNAPSFQGATPQSLATPGGIPSAPVQEAPKAQALSLPSKPEDVTPEAIQSLSTNDALMTAFRKKLGVKLTGTPEGNKKLLADNKITFATFANSLTDKQKAQFGQGSTPTSSTAETQSGKASFARSIVVTNPTPRTALAQSVLARAERAPFESFTPKERAAATSHVRDTIKVLDTPETRDLKRLGMTPERLEVLAKQLQAALNADPDMRDYIMNSQVLSEKDRALFVSTMKQNGDDRRLLQKAEADAGRNENAQMALALKAVDIENRWKLGYEKALQTHDRSKIYAYQTATAAISAYRAADQDVRANYLRQHPKANDEELDKALMKALADQSSGYALAHDNAISAISLVTGESPIISEMVLKGDKGFGWMILGENALGRTEDQTFPIPVNPGNPRNPRGPSPAPASGGNPAPVPAGPPKPAPSAGTGGFDPNKYLPQ
jgi:hypothetical protein